MDFNVILLHIKQHYPQLHFFIGCITVNGVTGNKVFDRDRGVAGLAWGIHVPFRQYMQRIWDGQMAAGDGAALLESEETYFPLECDTAISGELRFTGFVEFIGHNGMLAVTVRDPWLQSISGQWSLTIVDPFDSRTRMPLVEVDFQNAGIGTARLTETGTDLFMGNYNEGTVFDPVRMVLAEKDQNS